MIHINIDNVPGLKEALQKEAEQLGLSLNAYIRMILINRNARKD